jgi:PKD repeat protein
VSDYNTGSRFEFYFKGGQTDYFFYDGTGTHTTTVAYTSEALELQFTLTGTNTYSLQISRLASGTITNLTGTLAGSAGASLDSFVVYNRNAGGGSQYDFFANSFARLAGPPVASFAASPTNGVAPLLVNFTDTSTGVITTRLWDYGDGNTGTLASHTYAAGTKTVTLIVTGPGGTSTNTHLNAITVLADTVGDGIPDVWRQQNFGGDGTTTNALSCAACDPDGDGQSNLAEFLAGTGPRDAASVFQIIGVTTAGNDVQVSWATRTNKTYQLLRCPTPDNGTFCTSVGTMPGTDGVVTQSDPGAATNIVPQFYRVRLVP